MKKSLFFCFLAVICAMSLSAWEHSVDLEIASPYFSINAKNDGIKNVIEPQLSARYYGKESATAKGLGMELAFGAGYAFNINDRLTLSALGSLSLDWLRFKYKKEISARASSGNVTAEWTQSDNALFVGIGAELLARFKLTDHISIAGSLAMRFLDGGKLWKKGSNIGKNYDSSFDLRGNFILTPSLGASWTF